MCRPLFNFFKRKQGDKTVRHKKLLNFREDEKNKTLICREKTRIKKKIKKERVKLYLNF